MVKKIKKVAKALKKASALHKKQSKVIEKHIKEMKSYGRAKKGKTVCETTERNCKESKTI